MEDECQDLDIKIVASKAEHGTELGDSELDSHIRSLQQARAHEKAAATHNEEAQSISDYVTYLLTIAGTDYSEENLDPFITELLGHAERLRQKADTEESITQNC